MTTIGVDGMQRNLREHMEAIDASLQPVTAAEAVRSYLEARHPVEDATWFVEAQFDGSLRCYLNLRSPVEYIKISYSIPDVGIT